MTRTATLIRRQRPARLKLSAPAGPRGAVHTAVLSLVAMTFAVSGIVFTEPAPVDALLMGLIVLLPAVGLIRLDPLLSVYGALWAIVGAGGLIASTLSRDMAASTIFTLVSIYLTLASVIIAAFVARNPLAHTRLIFDSLLVGATLVAILALIGYFSLIPGAFELFTKFNRASGTFKDPNVFGPFLVPAVIYALHKALHAKPVAAIGFLGLAGLLGLAVLLSFSRGAWINLALAVAIYAALALATAENPRERNRVAGLVLAGAALIGVIVIAVTQIDSIAALLSDRASLTQSYDEGPEGRFGGQRKAIELLISNPFGIGAGQFTIHYHHEEVHSVFLSMFLNAGWVGGLGYWLITAVTAILGFRALLTPSRIRPCLIVVVAAYVATALEGIVIDTDHWRSFYILMGMVWGLAATLPPCASAGEVAA